MKRAEGPALPRIDIEAGKIALAAYAADAGQLKFYGLPAGKSGAWREYVIDGDGVLFVDGVAHRVRRMEWEDGQPEGDVKAWQFTKPHKGGDA